MWAILFLTLAGTNTSCADTLSPTAWVDCVTKEQEHALNHRLDNSVVNRARECLAKSKQTKCGGEWSFFSVDGGREERVDWNMSAISCATRVRQMRGAFNGKTYLCRKQDGILPDYL